MSRVLVVADDLSGGANAGPGLRIRAMAEGLGRENDVTVVGARDNGRTVTRAVEGHDVTITRPGLLATRQLQLFTATERSLVVDLTIPQPVEGLHYFAQFGEAGPRKHGAAQRRMRRTLMVGDFFLAAHEAQRQFWLGALLTLRDLPPQVVNGDPDLRTFIDLAPCGVSAENPPEPTPEQGCLLWGGGCWDWMDPVLLLSALADLRARGISEAFVLVPGTHHPDELVPVPRNLAAMDEARRNLCLPPDALRMSDGWTGGAERLSYLRRAQIGVSLHRPGLEPTLSWRHRILDYLWAGLPTIVTAGCPLAERIAAHGAGLIVPPGDRAACAAALESLLVDEDRRRQCRAGARALARELADDRMLQPLMDFCRAPRKAPDHGRSSWLRLARMVLA